MARTEVDLGPVDAYAIAVAEGYTGTREEWVQAMANAEANGLKAEGYAVGEQNGTPVASGEYFENNAKYYNEQAQSAKEDAETAQTAAETAQTAAETAQTAAETAQTAAETAAARDTAAWLNEHITNPDSPPLDRTLMSSSAAAPADMVGELKSAFNNAESVLYFDENVSIWDGFEKGSVGLYKNPWDYPNSNKYARNIKGHDIFLNVGTVVGLRDYTDYAYYIGARRADGTQIGSSGAWLTQDTITGMDGYYGIMFKRNDDANWTDTDTAAIANLLFVKHFNTNKLQISVFNGGLRADGNIGIGTSQRKYVTTQLIPVNENEQYALWERVPSGSVEIMYCYYSTARTALGSRITYATTNYIDRNGNKIGYTIITVPAGAKYMRLTFVGLGTYHAYRINGANSENISSENDVHESLAVHEGDLVALNKLKNNIRANLVLETASTPVMFNTFTNEMYIPSGTIVFANKTRYIMAQGVTLDISLATNDTTVMTVVFDVSNQSFSVVPNAAYTNLTETQFVVCTMRWYPYSCDRIKIDLDCPWALNGQMYGVPRQNAFVKAVAHRGLSYTAPENTLVAFRLASLWGFQYAETDIMFTSDNVPVLLHDPTINRTARNDDGTQLTTTVNIADITYAEALQYDFGIWKGQAWKGERIPKFVDFISLCRRMSLCPCIELKTDANLTQEKIKALIDIVVLHGLKYIAQWVSFSAEYLSIVKSYLPKAGLNMPTNGITDDLITTAIGLKTADNKVVISGPAITQTQLDRLIAADVDYAEGSTDDPNAIVSGNPYSLWQTSNGFIAGVTLSGYELKDLKL